MVNEAYVTLLCPECGRGWEEKPGDLPAYNGDFSCPHCHATRRIAEFMRTERDLDVLKRLQS